MRKILLFAAMLMLQALPAYSQETTLVLDPVGNGEAVVFQVPKEARQAFDAGEATVDWTVSCLEKMRVVQTSSKADFVVDPPVGWSGMIKVKCLVTYWESREQKAVCFVVGVNQGTLPDDEVDDGQNEDDNVKPLPDEEGEDDNTPPPPPPEPEYDGPNTHGLGQVSFDTAPQYNADAAATFTKAAEYLFGTPGQIKVIHDFTDPRNNDTEKNVFFWIRAELRRKGLTDADWVAWYNACDTKWRSVNGVLDRGLTIEQWAEVFNEVAAGVEAKK